MKVLKWLLVTVIAAAVVGLLIAAYVRGHKEEQADEAQEHPATAASRVRTEAGETFLTLDAEMQKKSGIETKPLAASMQRHQIRANAIVLSAQSLTQLRANHLSDLAQADKSKAALEVSAKEYERSMQLYKDNQNVSAKTLEAAEGAWRTDQVTLRAANESLQLNDTLARQAWGETVAKWVGEGSPEFDRILAQKDLLLQVSYPQGVSAAAPSVLVRLPSGRMQPAEFVSSYPAVDPRIQSASFLFRTSAAPELAPGMTLSVLVPAGPLQRGVIVPSGAVIWWQGKAWTYVQSAQERFARREVSADSPVAGGWFVLSGVAAGEKVVVRGGQQLLSEEFRSQIESPGDEGE